MTENQIAVVAQIVHILTQFTVYPCFYSGIFAFVRIVHTYTLNYTKLNMNYSRIFTIAAALSIGLCAVAVSCDKPESGIVIPDPSPVPAPKPDDPEPGPDVDPEQPEEGTLCTDIGQKPVVLAYYTENSGEVPDANLVTHINFAHGRFVNSATGEGGIVIGKVNTSTDNDKYVALLRKVVDLKKVNPKLKVLLMIGGWGMNADGFSMMARSEKARTEFCKSVKSKLDKYNLDGVDIDWEYPTRSAEGTAYHVNDKENFILVLKELRQTLGTTKIISFASSSSAEYMNWPEAIKYLDYVNVMTYDMGCAPDKHNSPLYRSGVFSQTSCDESITKHLSKGIPLNRMNLGIPYYGKAEKNSSIFEYEVKYNEMDDILNKGRYDGKEMKVQVTRRWDPVAKVPYLTDPQGKIVLVYDDPESVAAKGEYVVSKGLLGAMCWEYRHDDSNHSLQKALVNAIYGKESVIQTQ